MNGEVALGGVYLSSALPCALLALVLGLVLRRVLEPLGFYRLVWHRALFDLALFVILWGAVTALSLQLRC